MKGVTHTMIKQLKRTTLTTTLLMGTLVLAGCGSSDIALDDYLELTYDGVDGYGEVTPTLDTEALAAEHADAIDEDSKPAGITNEEFLASTMLSHVSLSVDKEQNLSNGDEIVAMWDVSNQETIEDLLGVTLAYEDVEIEVDELVEAETFDAFAEIEMVYSGFAPSGQASLDTTDSPFSHGSFTLEPISELENGDVVTVTINETAIDDIVHSEGRVPAETVKEYTVDGLSTYVTELGDISSDAVDKMDQQGQDALTAHVAKEWTDASRYDGATLLGHYLLTRKEPERFSQKNRVVLAYEITTKDNFTFYSHIEFYNLLNLADGTTTVDESQYSMPGGFGARFRTDDGLSYLGYESLDELFNEKVAQHVDEFKYETTLE